MLIIAGHLTIAAGERDRYLEHCRPIVARARSADGCLDFALNSDILDPDRITIYERWSTDDALERFRAAAGGQPPTDLFVDAEVARYRITAVEPA